MAPEPLALQVGHTVVLTIQESAAEQFAQVQVSGAVLAEQGEPPNVVRVTGVPNQDIGANDGFQSGADRLAVKLDQGEKIVLVSDRHGRHAKLPAARYQVF